MTPQQIRQELSARIKAYKASWHTMHRLATARAITELCKSNLWLMDQIPDDLFMLAYADAMVPAMS